MRHYIIRHALEFVVIVMGISLSFYLEKQNATAYKDTLKNQSLGRILKNIEIDVKDYKFNLIAHNNAIESINWLENHRDQLYLKTRDSIGFHYGRALIINTVFVDNQEEYRAIQNSGLIELIENEEVVLGLQNKYSYHKFIKFLEEMIQKELSVLSEDLYTNTRLVSPKLDSLGYLFDRTFVGQLPIPHHVFERLITVGSLHDYYNARVKSRIRRDSVLRLRIEKEIQ